MYKNLMRSAQAALSLAAASLLFSPAAVWSQASAPTAAPDATASVAAAAASAVKAVASAAGVRAPAKASTTKRAQASAAAASVASGLKPGASGAKPAASAASNPAALLGLDKLGQTDPLKVGFVYVAPLMPAGWVAQHDAGRRIMQQALGDRVKTTYVENVAEGADAERVIRDLAQQGHKLIITPSYGYMEPTLKVAKDFPDVKFESVTGYKTAGNVAASNARYYEGRYLAGIAAGRMTKTNVAGYVAGFPVPEVLQGINAFAMGMRSVNPKAQVKVVWLNSWFDPPREREAAMTLMNQNADVMAFHSGSDAVMIAAQERKKLAVAYHSDMRKVAPDAQIAAITHEWGRYYTQRAQAVLGGRWEPGWTWGGVKEGMVRVGEFGPKVSKAVQDEVMSRQEEMVAGKLAVFRAGPSAVNDNEGKPVIPANSALTDDQINAMTWLVEGVIGKVSK